MIAADELIGEVEVAVGAAKRVVRAWNCSDSAENPYTGDTYEEGIDNTSNTTLLAPLPLATIQDITGSWATEQLAFHPYTNKNSPPKPAQAEPCLSAGEASVPAPSSFQAI